MRSLPRLTAAAAGFGPALAAAQGAADPAATGRSVWNWVLLGAAVVVVIALAIEIFGGGRRAGSPPRS